MRGLEKLARTKIGKECAVVPLPDKDMEVRHYVSFSEPGVPKPIVDLVAFCDWREIRIAVHRKPITQGCVEAVQARSVACGAEIQLHQELKVVVLKTMENIKVAFYMCGDHELSGAGSELARRHRILPPAKQIGSLTNGGEKKPRERSIG